MIEFSGLTKSFGGREVLRGVDLCVSPGRVTAVVGSNGAGKTTLIKCLVGLVRPDGGEMRIDGVRLGDDPAYRAAIGYSSQMSRFPEHLTAREVTRILLDLRGESAVIDWELFERLALAPHLDTRVRALSGGTRQKLAVALAFLFAPRVLVLDEPSAGLDPMANAVLKDKILSERGKGATVLVTSHVMSELDELADDVVFLRAGRVGYVGSAQKLRVFTGQPHLERAIASMMTRDVICA
ncbi:MAG TPA: ABC transporter ATP-binding protein [Gemmatimonadaceae bacterium]